jgi:Plasmid recombination enzyme
MKAIMRTTKLKSYAEVSAIGHHVWRVLKTGEDGTLLNTFSNAVSSRTHLNETRIGSGDLVADVTQRINDSGVTVSKNSVLAVEFMLTASPEYFRPDNPQTPGVWDEDRMRAWADATENWLRKKYGANLVAINLQLDESSPHISAFVVPFNEKTGRLSAKALITGGAKKLSELQSEYADVLKPLGIDRGLKGSKATHTEIKKWYGKNSTLPIPAPNAALPKPKSKDQDVYEYRADATKHLNDIVMPYIDELNATINNLQLAVKQLTDERDRVNKSNNMRKFLLDVGRNTEGAKSPSQVLQRGYDVVSNAIARYKQIKRVEQSQELHDDLQNQQKPRI